MEKQLGTLKITMPMEVPTGDPLRPFKRIQKTLYTCGGVTLETAKVLKGQFERQNEGRLEPVLLWSYWQASLVEVD